MINRIWYEYLQRRQKEIRAAPQARWEASGFLPQMPDSLERLDLLLLQVAKARRVHQDGIYFEGKRYLDLTLVVYVGKDVTIRYDPRDMAEIRVFYHNTFLCRAICAELAGETISLKEIEVFHLLQEQAHDKQEAREGKGLAHGDDIGGRERSFSKQRQGKHGMAGGLFTHQQKQEEERTSGIRRENQRRRAAHAVAFNQRKGQQSQCENTGPLTWKIKASSSLWSRWRNRTGGEQKAEDTYGKIDQEDAAPPKRVDQHTPKQRTRKGSDARDGCPDTNRLRPFPCVSIDRIEESERIGDKQGCTKSLDGARDLQDEQRGSQATQRGCQREEGKTD